ncbi:uncharacterized protein LOC18436985 isoform X1 [Amborella trichopoda]|uniref:uncharacterized protein LOC18436985 isoform X1 n=1 Tax=Amborella trichopoda TaxID=13333 RepID=UPI0009BDE2F9|nr:uncharacterized protein LOC18436985 isoform X1 [Amborella trichopoda]|eukprot:XP_020524608.1 uncharacterized protein LOC18436985 isoform X1 [Amborella trichopoda]
MAVSNKSSVKASPVKPKLSANPSSPRKTRIKSPGVRVISGRIYDSENGKTCHQCRQKTMDFMASCRNMRQGKPCTINFCHKCLLNRYGENAEEMAGVDGWNCPKCRGICNCSFCMGLEGWGLNGSCVYFDRNTMLSIYSFCRKKRGQEPTGILAHTAKATGFSSVSEMLNTLPSKQCTQPPCSETLGPKEVLNDPHDYVVADKQLVSSKKKCRTRKKNGNDACANDGLANSETSKKPRLASKEKENLDSRRVIGDAPIKEASRGDSCKGDVGINGNLRVSGDKGQNVVFKKTEKRGVTNPNGCRDSLEVSEGNQSPKSPQEKKVSHLTLEKQSKKRKVLHEGKDEAVRENQKKESVDEDVEINGQKQCCTVIFELGKPINLRKKKKQAALDLDANVDLPQGNALKELAGVDLPDDDVGPALQFLEFCAAFGNFLDLKKGQSESVLREITRGRIGRRGIYSSSLQFHMKLLSLMLKDLEEDSPIPYSMSNSDSWVEALKKYVSKSQSSLKEIPFCFLNNGSDGYDKLEPSKKLKIMNFLCDEALGTECFRSWIDEENEKFIKRVKEGKEKVLAAKERAKIVKQKMRDELPQILLASRNGTPASVHEHENLVSKIKRESEKAYAQISEALEAASKLRNQRSDAVRTENILLDKTGRVYWRLKGDSDKAHVMIQDFGSWDLGFYQEKWFIYDDDQEKELVKYVASLRMKSSRFQKVHVSSELESSELCLKHDVSSFKSGADDGDHCQLNRV